MTAVALERASSEPSAAGPFVRLAPFCLAGMALFGMVLDEIDSPHDNAEGLVVIGAGALSGLVVGLLLGGRASVGGVARRIAWDLMRFVLAYEVIRYGVPKLIGAQFYPQYWRLDERVADLSPMALAWVFLGRTYAYQAFGGLIEVASGILVCFRRTTLLGACVMSTALLNVVLIDHFYSVPVKLFASLYFLFDVALITREWRRLWAFFTAPVPRVNRGKATKWLYALAVVTAIVLPVARELRMGVVHRVFQKDALEGAWSIDDRSGAADPSWQRLYVEKPGVGSVRVGKKRFPFAMEVRGDRLRLSIAGGEHTLDGTLALRGASLRIDGTCDGTPCTLTLNKEFPR